VNRVSRFLRVGWLRLNGWEHRERGWRHPLASSFHHFTMEQALRITVLTTPDLFGVLKNLEDER